MEEENLVPGTEGILFETTITRDAPVENDNTIRAYHDPVDTNRIISDDEIYTGYVDRLTETPLTAEDVIEAPHVTNGATSTLEMRDEVPTGQFYNGVWHQFRRGTVIEPDMNDNAFTQESINRQIRDINEESLRAEQRAREHVQRITREQLGAAFRTDRNESTMIKHRSDSKDLMKHLMPFLEKLKKEGRLDVDTFNDIYIKMDEYVRGV